MKPDFSKTRISWLVIPATASRDVWRIHSLFFADNLLPLALFVIVVFPATVFALGQEKYVETVQHPNAFSIAREESLASIYVDVNDYAGVVLAARDLQADLAR